MSARKLRVLLAEDDAIGARFAIAAVERLGHAVVSVESGRGALDLLKREPFDVALLDLGLPGLSGLDVARRIRSHEQANDVETPLVIVALTASDLDDVARDAAGIDAVLEKPVHVVLLGETLERCCRVRANSGPEAGSVVVLDLEALSERASHEEEFIRELLRDFLDGSEGTPREIAALVEAGRHHDAAKLSHRLRGSLLAVGANCAARATGELETLCGSLAAAPVVTELQRATLSHVAHACFATIEDARGVIRLFLEGASELCRAAS